MLDFSKFDGRYEFFSFFEEISKIPRGSGNTKKIADYLELFAKERGLFCYRDSSDNVVIKKSGTVGFEGTAPVILQGHTDMVIATEPDIPHDITKDGVDIYIDGDFLKARGSTLEADNGVAVAYMLALLDSRDIPHPPIEAVFTSDEEIGLIGAAALDASVLSGKAMINLDSDEEGIFIAGCAGGLRTDITLSYESVQADEHLEIIISGLRGGHSGGEINKGRVNAIRLLGEIIPDGIPFGEIKGGTADNAIADFCSFKAYPSDKLLENIENALKKHSAAEPGLKIECAQKNCGASLISAEDSVKLLTLLRDLPCGVVAMNRSMPHLVETSMNFGIIETRDNAVTLSVSMRSSDNDEKAKLKERVVRISENCGAKTISYGDYPGWKYREESKLRDTFSLYYEKLFGKTAKTVTIHAGLECGIFSDKIEDLDCISLGPLAYDIHTPKERLSISSAIRVYKLLCEVLSNYKGENK